ncbi:hypothetical protein B0I35DRAFT_443864 [Stachybotrys elegans]|uniref:Uncharacterized protein n=1 Tax=Stachybotrys elegans TaxID=80388 RepID=A0A8K0WM25_9HYPO|nr:hypothetical protein B0I35DRAFT_443864 [Stachybotrys elegans]
MSSYGKNQNAWSTFVGSWNHLGRSKSDYMRLAIMDLIMLSRTAHFIGQVVRMAAERQTTTLIIDCIIGPLGTVFVAWSLGSLGVARGERRVLGVNWSRLHFDILLGFFLLLSLGLLIAFFMTSGLQISNILFTTWCVVWILISLGAWVAGKCSTNDSPV